MIIDKIQTREYRVKPFWRGAIMVLSLFGIVILVFAWLEGLSHDPVDPRIFFIAIVILPVALHGLFVYPRMRMVLTNYDIQLCGLRRKRIVFKDMTGFKVHANAVFLESPNTKFWISRGFEKQWEIVDFVARRLVALGRIPQKQYEDMRPFFHGYDG
jgi:hypothetical protein